MVAMSADLQIREGCMPFRGHRTWHRIVGDHEAAGRRRFDECTPGLQEDLHRRLPGSQRTVFEESARLPYLEEPERFREAADGFLERVEGRSP